MNMFSNTQHQLKYNCKYLFALSLIAFTLTKCPQEFPQQELAQARLHLAAAQEEGVASADPDSYKQAQSQLLTAHQLLSQEKYDNAKESAQKATQIAIGARLRRAPAYLDALENEADSSLAKMEEQGIAEVSPVDYQVARASIAKARNYRKEGDDLQNNLAASGNVKDEQEEHEHHKRKVLAEQGNAALSIDAEEGAAYEFQHRRALAKYRNAALSYLEVRNISQRLRESLEAQALDLGSALERAAADIAKARLYGANVQQLAEPTALLKAARDAHAAKKNIEADAKLKSLQGKLQTLLLQLEPKYAQKLLDTAKKAVDNAQKVYDAEDTPKKREDAQQVQSLDAMNGQLASAREAVQAAQTFLQETNYRESIKESEDAIRLSDVVLEQSQLGKQVKRGAVITSDGNGLVEDIGGGWKRYTVRQIKPADCLWCIAARKEVYGKGHLWRRIYQVNRSKVKDPNLIYPGQVLLIPPPQGAIGTPPDAPDASNAADTLEATEEIEDESVSAQDEATPELDNTDTEASSSDEQ